MKFCMLILVFGLSLLSWLHESRAENIDCDENGKCRELSSKDEPETDKDEPEGVYDLDTTDGDKKHESDSLPKIGRINLSATKTKAGKKDRKKKGGKDRKKKGRKDGKKKGRKDPKKKGGNKDKKGKGGKNDPTKKGEKPNNGTEVPQEQHDIPGGIIKKPVFIYLGEDSLLLNKNQPDKPVLVNPLLPDKKQPEKPVGDKPSKKKPGKNQPKEKDGKKAPKKKGKKPPKTKSGKPSKPGSKGRNKDAGIIQLDVLNAGFNEQDKSGVKSKASFLYIGGASGILCVVTGIFFAIVVKKRKKSEKNDEELMEADAEEDEK